MGDIPTNPMSPVTEAVFNTYELLESIILALPAKDIIAARGVTKAWRTMIDSSISINKRIMSSALVTTSVINRTISRSTFTVASVVWGDIIVKKVSGTELIFVADRLSIETSFSRFIRYDENISGLNDDDRARLAQGWTAALSQSDVQMSTWPGEVTDFVRRLVHGLIALIYPRDAEKRVVR